MAARVSARDLGGPPPVSVKQKPYRKLKAAKKPPLVTGLMSHDTLGQIAEAMRQVADKQVAPPPPVEDEIRHRRKAIREEAKAKPSSPASKPKASKKGKKAKAQQQSNATPRYAKRLAELRAKHLDGRPMAAQPLSPTAVKLRAEASEFDINRFTEILQRGHTSDANLYLRIYCDNNRQVMAAVLAQHADVIKPVALAMEQTEYGKVIPRVKSEPAVHPDEKVRVAHVRTRIKYIGKRKLVQRKRRMVSEGNLNWIESHTPIDAMCPLVVTTRKGVTLVHTEEMFLTERMPLMVGNLQIGKVAVTQRIEIPVRSEPQRSKGGHLPYPLAAMRAMSKTHRSQKRRARLGYSRIPTSAIFEEESVTVTVGEVPEAANDSVPWEVTPVPPTQPNVVNTAVVLPFPVLTQPLVWVGSGGEEKAVSWWHAPDETTFFNEVVRQREARAKYLCKKYQLSHDPKYRADLERRIESKKAERALYDRMLIGPKLRRIRAQFTASWLSPNYKPGISHPPKPHLVSAVTRNPRIRHYHGRRVSARLRTRMDQQCPALLTGQRSLVSNMKYGELCFTTRKVFRRIFHAQMLEQKDYVRNQLWLKAHDPTLGWSHDNWRYDQWCMTADREAHSKDVTDHGLQMHLLGLEQYNPSLYHYRNPEWAKSVELFDVKWWPRIEIKTKGKVACINEARAKLREKVARMDRQAEAKEMADKQATAASCIIESLSSGNEMLQGLNEEERTAYYNTIAGRSDPSFAKLPPFSALKSIPKPDYDFAKVMFERWLKKDRGLVLPPDIS